MSSNTSGRGRDPQPPFTDPSFGFVPWGGWQDGHPPWTLDNQSAWNDGSGSGSGFGDIFAAGGAANHQPQPQQGAQQYASPYVNVPDGDRVVEPAANPWDVIKGIGALGPVVREAPPPRREVRWLGPQPGEIPLAQQFEREAMDWRAEGPPGFQVQRGRPAPVAQVGGEGMGMGMGMDVDMDMGMGWGMQGFGGGMGDVCSHSRLGGSASTGQASMQRGAPPLPPQQQQQSQEREYAYRNLGVSRMPKGPSYQDLYMTPGRGPGRTVWEEQNLLRPQGLPPSWKDTRAFGPGEGGFDAATIQQLEQGDLSQFPNLEAVDEGPRRAGESITAWRARVVTSRKAIGVVHSELRRRPYSFPTTSKQANDTPEQFKARLYARRKVKAQWEKDKEIHKNKMDHTHQSFDPEYAAQYRAEKAARQFANAKRRKTALLIARRIAERDNQPRPLTPPLPEDSSDEDLPAMPPRDRGAFAGGPGPRPKRCLYCKHMRKPCTLVSGSPRPCDRCKSRGIVCEITRDLEDPKAAPPAWKLKEAGGARYDEDEEEEEEDEPVGGQQRVSLVRKKRAAFNQRPKRSAQTLNRRRRSASPEMEFSSNKQCTPCKDQARPCDGERPCGTCSFNGTEDMCSPVSYFSRYRQRDYREEGGSLQRGDSEEGWDTILAGVNDDNIHVEWENLLNDPEAAEEAIRNMDLGPMMNYSSAVIQESIEAGRQNTFLQQNFHNNMPAMQPFQPVPDGPAYNRLGTVVEPDASYTSLAPTGPEFTAEPFGDVAYYTGMIFDGNGTDFEHPEIAPENSVERPDLPTDNGLDGILDAVERQRQRSGIQVAVLHSDAAPAADPDPDPSLQGPPLAHYRRAWTQDLRGIRKTQHCDELIGIDICFKNPAKHCDYLQHGIEGGDWFTCVGCHQGQNVRVADAQETVIEYTKLYYCDECATKQRPRARGRRGRPAANANANAGLRKDYCTCVAQMRKSWLCNTHRDEAISDVMERSIAVKNWMVRRKFDRCNGCDARGLGERTAMWACASCKEVVYV